MNWVRSHPYAALCALAGILLVIGAILVERRTAAKPGSLTVWGGSGAPLLNPSSYTPNAVVENMNSGSGVNVSPAYIPPANNTTVNASNDVYDLGDLLSMISESGTKNTSPQPSSDVGVAYAFVPGGLIATSLPVAERTEAQQQLFNYGNDVGSYIQTYEDSHQNAPILLRDQAEDRRDPDKAKAVKLVAAALETVGKNIAGIEEVPSTAVSVHSLLAQSYVDAGKSLAKVPDAESDASFIAALESYNATADALAKNYVALSIIFSLNQIKFAPEDPGSIFMFSGGGTLQ